MSSTNAVSRLHPTALLVFLVWTVEGILWTGQVLVAAQIDGRDLDTLRPLAMQMGMAYAWALLTWLILVLGRRYPIDRQSWTRSAAVHLAVSLAASFLFNVLKVSLAQATGQARMGDSSLFLRSIRNFVWYFDFDLVMYWFILGVSHLVAHVQATRQREMRASQLEAQLAQARLSALEMQLHPHFLFNALHSVAALVRTNQNALAVRMIAALGDLLRLALDRAGGQEVALKQELELLDRYLEIEQLRFGDRLRVERDIDPATLDARVPHLILQPLVENAIRHGLAPAASGECLRLTTRRRNDSLVLTVEDDGVGLPAGFAEVTPQGVGLRNTSERLAQLYGQEGSLTLRQAKPTGVIATVTLPYRLAVDEWRADQVVTDVEPSHAHR